MLSGYIDGSNLHSDATVVVVAGVVANTTVWSLWEDRWRELLDFSDVYRWHHTDFITKRRKRKSGSIESWPYANWLWSRGLLCEAFEAVAPTYFGATLWSSDYNVLRSNFPSLPPDPYYFLLDRCMHRLIQGLFEHPIDDGIAVHCDQDKDRALVEDLGKWHMDYLRANPGAGHPEEATRKVTITYGSNVDYMPLQAADVVAHEIMRFVSANPTMRGVAVTDNPDAWILDRLRKQKSSAWLGMNYSKEIIEMEMDGRAWVPGHWPGYRFVASPSA